MANYLVEKLYLGKMVDNAAFLPSRALHQSWIVQQKKSAQLHSLNQINLRSTDLRRSRTSVVD